MTSSAEQSAFY